MAVVATAVAAVPIKMANDALGNPIGKLFGGGGGSDVPGADPAIGQAALENAQLGRDQLAFNKQVYADNKPVIDKANDLNNQVVQSQLGISKVNQEQASQQWDRFKSLFMPVEDRMVSDANNIDSAANQEKEAGAAGGAVRDAYAKANDSNSRQLASMGINPNSGRALDVKANSDMAEAADEANAMNSARTAVKDKGIALRIGTANFGRNMPNTAAQSTGLALQSGNSVVGNNSATINNGNANTAIMNAGYAGNIAANNSAASILNQKHATDVSGWSAQQQADATSSAGMGQLAGQLGAAAMPYVFSSKKLKTDKSPVNDSETLQRLKNTPIAKWRYKKGVADGGQHVGPYAEDMQQKFGDHVAPGGKVIDVISQQGITMSAVKGLAKQVDKLSGKVDRLAAASKGK